MDPVSLIAGFLRSRGEAELAGSVEACPALQGEARILSDLEFVLNVSRGCITPDVLASRKAIMKEHSLGARADKFLIQPVWFGRRRLLEGEALLEMFTDIDGLVDSLGLVPVTSRRYSMSVCHKQPFQHLYLKRIFPPDSKVKALPPDSHPALGYARLSSPFLDYYRSENGYARRKILKQPIEKLVSDDFTPRPANIGTNVNIPADKIPAHLVPDESPEIRKALARKLDKRALLEFVELKRRILRLLMTRITSTASVTSRLTDVMGSYKSRISTVSTDGKELLWVFDWGSAVYFLPEPAEKVSTNYVRPVSKAVGKRAPSKVVTMRTHPLEDDASVSEQQFVVARSSYYPNVFFMRKSRAYSQAFQSSGEPPVAPVTVLRTGRLAEARSEAEEEGEKPEKPPSVLASRVRNQQSLAGEEARATKDGLKFKVIQSQQGASVPSQESSHKSFEKLGEQGRRDTSYEELVQNHLASPQSSLEDRIQAILKDDERTKFNSVVKSFAEKLRSKDRGYSQILTSLLENTAPGAAPSQNRELLFGKSSRLGSTHPSTPTQSRGLTKSTVDTEQFSSESSGGPRDASFDSDMDPTNQSGYEALTLGDVASMETRGSIASATPLESMQAIPQISAGTVPPEVPLPPLGPDATQTCLRVEISITSMELAENSSITTPSDPEDRVFQASIPLLPVTAYCDIERNTSGAHNSLDASDATNAAKEKYTTIQRVIRGELDHEALLGATACSRLPIHYNPLHTGALELPTPEDADVPFLEGETIIGRYKLLKMVGSATFSNVFSCLDLRDNQTYCLKVIKQEKEFFDQAIDEVHLLELLREVDPNNCANVIKIHDYFYFREHLLLKFSLLGEDLYTHFNKREKKGQPNDYTLPVIREMSRQILKALDYIHRLGITHLDLKPENLLHGDKNFVGGVGEPSVTLVDFGSSSFVFDKMHSYIQSRSYRAPEIILATPYDTRADIWSFGCLVCELLTGRVLFPNYSVATILSRICALIGPIPREMIMSGRMGHRMLTFGLVPYETDDKTRQSFYFTPQKGLLEYWLFGERCCTLTDEEILFSDFCRQALIIDPIRRPTASMLLEHPFITGLDSFM